VPELKRGRQKCGYICDVEGGGGESLFARMTGYEDGTPG